MYEYLLTLPTEVRIIWSSPAKLASIFYLIIRYCVLLTVICTMARGIRVPGPMMSPKRYAGTAFPAEGFCRTYVVRCPQLSSYA